MTSNNVIHQIRFRPQRYGPIIPEDEFLMLEADGFLLTEDNEKIILEDE